MITIFNKLIPFKGYTCMYLFGILFVRKDAMLTPYVKNHERIHQAQCREMLYIFFYIWYVIEWLIRLLQYRNFKQAYRNILFEREAYDNMYDLGYIDSRNYFAWL